MVFFVTEVSLNILFDTVMYNPVLYWDNKDSNSKHSNSPAYVFSTLYTYVLMNEWMNIWIRPI